MRQIVWTAFLTCSVLAAGLPALAQTQTQRGEYLATIMDCTGCHTPGTFLGKPDMQRYLGGSEVGFQIPGLGFSPRPTSRPIPRPGWAGEVRPISSRLCEPVSGRIGVSSHRSCRITSTVSSQKGMPELSPAISRA